MKEVTYSEYESALAALWFDDAVEAGLLDGPSGVVRETCLDALALAQEHNSLAVESDDDDLPIGEILSGLLVGLAVEYLENRQDHEMDDCEMEERWDEISEIVQKVLSLAHDNLAPESP
jgi:hypothetical protein